MKMTRIAVLCVALLASAPATADILDVFVGREINFKTSNTNRFLRHRDFFAYTDDGGVNPDGLFRKDARFRVVAGLAGQCLSFESYNFPGYFLRHQLNRVMLSKMEASKLFREDATFCPVEGLAGMRGGDGWSFKSFNYPDKYMRHKFGEVWIDPNDGTDLFKQDATWLTIGLLNLEPS